MMANINIKNGKAVKDKLEEIADEITEIMKQQVYGGFVPQAIITSGNTTTISAHSVFRMVGDDDLEQRDTEAIEKLIELYFETTYPDFEPEIVHGMDKDYYLPALKVLGWDGESFYSPQRKAKWDKLELVAKCENKRDDPGEHDWESCQCGVYGSVNLEEIQDFLNEWTVRFPDDYNRFRQYSFSKKLVLIEPSPNADVILSRKGWRAQSAFISEIVGETVTLEEVSRLLSVAWHRTIDIRELKYENR